ncbi:MAG: hypothetical protein ACE5EA_06340 [Nitrospirota bacterium]
MISWRDIPSHDLLKERFLVFTIFACSYMGFLCPLINDREFDRKMFLVPWYADHFDREELGREGIRKEMEETYR